MIVWKYEGLLLKPTKTKKGQYRRVGTLELGDEARETAGLSMMTVTLEGELCQAVETWNIPLRLSSFRRNDNAKIYFAVVIDIK